MKRKLSVLLACIIMSCMAAGCQNSSKTDESSAASAESAASDTSAASKAGDDTSKTSAASKAGDDTSETSAASKTDGDTSKSADTSKADGDTSKSADTSKAADTSKTDGSASAADTSDTGSTAQDSDTDVPVEESPEGGDGDVSFTIEGDGISIDEDGNITIDPTQFSGLTEDSGDSGDTGDDGGDVEEPGADDLFANGYQMIQLSPDGFTDGTTLPACYLITSAAELSDFIKNNSKVYSLDKEHTDDESMMSMSFKNETKDMTDEFFKDADILVVVSDYAKGTDGDLGNAVVTDKDAKIEVWAEKPATSAERGYICFIAAVNKDSLKGKTLSAWVNADYLKAEEG